MKIKSLLFVTTFLGALVSANADSEKTLKFACSLKEAADTMALVTVNEANYNNPDLIGEDIQASVELYKDGQMIKSVENALIGERLPVLFVEGKVIWGFSASLGRSGKLAMGYDAVNDSWSLIVDTVELESSGADNADCIIANTDAPTN